MVRITLVALALIVCVPRATLAQEIQSVEALRPSVGSGQPLPNSRAPLVLAGCTFTHQECTYPCIEWYPNKTDCRKTKKVCVTVCDDYDVKKSGEAPHGQPSSGR